LDDLDQIDQGHAADAVGKVLRMVPVVRVVVGKAVTHRRHHGLVLLAAVRRGSQLQHELVVRRPLRLDGLAQVVTDGPVEQFLDRRAHEVSDAQAVPECIGGGIERHGHVGS